MDAARDLLDGGFYEWTCFLSQQACEKAVKAVFYKLGMELFSYPVSGLLYELSKFFKVDEDLIDMVN